MAKPITIILFILMSVLLMGNTGCTEQDLSKTEKYLEKGQDVVNTLGSTVPATQPWAAIIAGGLGLAGTIVGAVKAKKSGKRANDYRDAIEAGVSSGGDQRVADVDVMQEVLDTDTKNHFNSTGKVRL